MPNTGLNRITFLAVRHVEVTLCYFNILFIIILPCFYWDYSIGRLRKVVYEVHLRHGNVERGGKNRKRK